MAFHHVAIATNDLEATHRFYTDVMGFELAKTEVAPAPEGGWARHLFYDTGDGTFLAFWDLHDDPAVPVRFDASISRGLGLPSWTNHLAFDAPDLDTLDEVQRRWLDHGYDVLRIDHGWCESIYVDDPNGIAVEFCCTTAPLSPVDRSRADELRRATTPPLATPPDPQVVEAVAPAAP
jgi:catechol 2,3-dioxygenase-like lactoylglutathione lyase family enzyme